MLKQTLYARDSKGKILEWSVATEEVGLNVNIRISYGEFEGSKAIKWRSNIKGKNIGKANETSPIKQAESDCESLIKRQVDKGYMSLGMLGIEAFEGNLLALLETHLPKYRQDASGNIKPMKAQQYYRSKKNWTDPTGKVWTDRKYYYILNGHAIKEPNSVITKFPCMGQPKINGVRATIIEENGKHIIKSKEGLIYNLPHITRYLDDRMLLNSRDTPLVLDGELYIHGESLQSISSAVKAANLLTLYLKFVMFDVAIQDYTNLERWQQVKEIHNAIDGLNCPFELIQTTKLTSDTHAQKFTDLCIKNGYEGIICRDMEAHYKFGSRPTTMTKLKRAISAEFKIINVLPQEIDSTKANFECITKNGERFAVDPKGTDEYKRSILNSPDEFIGKNLTITFYEYTDIGKPLHLLEAVVRDYE